MQELADKIKQFDLLKEVEKTKKKYKLLINRILDRNFYCPDRGDYCPEWNIKVSGDYSGHSGSEKTDKKWDILWEKWLEEHKENFFWNCCEDGLGFVGDKKTRDYDWHGRIPEIEGCDYELYQAGRSGGHLYLKTFDGQETNKGKFKEIAGYLDETIDIETDFSDVEGWIGDIDNILPGVDWLKKLLMFCESLDRFDATEEWNHQCNYRRSEKEAEWEDCDFNDFNENELQETLDQEYPDMPDNASDKTILEIINKCFDLIDVQDKIKQYFREEGQRLIKQGEEVYA